MNIKKLVLILLLLGCITNLQAQYYNPAFGLNGAPLKTALHNIINGHSAMPWPLWSYFNSTDMKPNGQVWDIYSDVPGGTPPYVFQFVTNQCGTYSQESDCFNHEHSFPSTFFNDMPPMRTDLHHVFPTDGYVNNKRSNYPYGKVTGSVNYTAQNGGKLGFSNTYTGYTDKVFEPIDSFKGDVARAYFYMSTRYENEDASFTNWTMAVGALLTQDAVTLLMDWHHKDPVSQKEVDRNQAIYTIQGNRNPFIDYPIFADCIWGTADCSALSTGNLEKQMQVQVYPNPASDMIQLVLPSTQIKILQISIYNIWGQCMYRADQYTTGINISLWPPAMYNMVIQSNLGSMSHSFIKS
ncbi:MAG: endonuclease [Chitinophagaceae bacterium]|nr:endonuclease [Chitinophagaceae bacterium]